MAVRKLVDISIRITRFPAFVMASLSLSNINEMIAVKIMFPGKVRYALSNIFGPIGANENHSSHLGLGGYSQFLSCFGGIGFAFSCLRNLAFSFFTLLIAKVGKSQFFAGFKRAFLVFPVTCTAKISRSCLFDRLGGLFCSQPGASGRVDVVPIMTKGFELIKPVLLSLDQEWGKNEFYNLENKSIRTILIPCSLQRDAVVSIVPKLAEMSVFTPVKVHSTSKIDFAGYSANNAVNARCVGDSIAFRGIMRLHLHNLLIRLVGVLPRGVTASLGSPYYTTSIPLSYSFSPSFMGVCHVY